MATSVADRIAVGEGADAATARAWLDANGWPGRRDEAWKYTPVDEILASLEVEVVAEELVIGEVVAQEVAVTSADVDDLAGDHGGPRIVFVDGRHAPHLSTSHPLGDGAWCGARGDGDAAEPVEVVRYDGFQALNHLAAHEGAVVEIHAGIEVDLPIHIVHLAVPTASRLAQPRTTIRLGDAARATVIETYTGLPGATFVNASTTIALGEGAHLDHHRIQTESAEGIHVGHTRTNSGADSQLRSTSVMLGAAIARHALDLTLRGEHAHANLEGLYLPRGYQRHDNVLTVDHAASHGTTVQLFKGVIGDEARGSFGGHVIVRPDTVGTSADQTNRNLLLARTAQADTRPWLEIFADDVRCTHGATVGRLDDDALFYLRSRGIPRTEARAMLITAFADEIIDHLTPASLRGHVHDAVRRQTEDDT
ncbi:MAG: Fe-S cluster assembly protein SufD [Acidimicrobiia bacterium]|nr:Fe-S cluster assembly protein SufD [Acidimicrobiia bacterium]